MNYTAEKITYLKAGDCPICLGERKDCRSTGELIHCYSHNEPPAAYEHKGLSAIGASLYAPIRDNSKPFDRLAHQARLAKQARQKGQALNILPSLEWRDRTIKSYPQKITVAQNADLLRRDLTQAEINFAISNHWIFGLQGGYGISAYDPISKLLVGAQRANDDRTKKYTWGIFTGRNKLKETGENPLFVWVSPSFNSSLSYEIKYSEGALKPLVRALQEWRTNQQIIVIGAAGGIFGNKALERVLSAFPDATKHTLLPDADSLNGKKLNIGKVYSDLADAIPSLKFADWGQWQKSKQQGGLDCDETYATNAFNRCELRSPREFLKAFEKLKLFEQGVRAANKRLQASKIKPDLELDRLPTIDELNELFKTHRDIFLNAPKGLGKSEIMGKFISQSEYALLPTPLESLAKNNAKRFSVDYRTDCDRVNGQLASGNGYVKRLSYCVEASLGLKGHIQQVLEKGAAVGNDELDLQLNSLATSSTHAKDGKRSLNQSLYWETQTRAIETLSVSADLTNYEAQLLWERKTGRKPFAINVRTAKKHYPCTVYTDDVNLHLELEAAILRGERVMICCSRKSEAKFLAWRFRHYGAIAIHRDNANEPIFQGSETEPNFFGEPNPWLEKHKPRILIVSPVLRSGFSITTPAFDSVYCFFHADSIPASTSLQLSERYRLPVPRHIYAAKSNGKYRHCTPEDVLATRQRRAKSSKNDELQWVDKNDSYYHYRSADNWSRAHFLTDIVARLRDEVEVVELDWSEADEDDLISLKKYKKDFKEWEQKQLLNARNLSKDEFDKLKDRRDLLEADLLAVEKYRLSDWSDRTPDTMTLGQIERDRKGKKRIELERLEKQAYPALAIASDKKSIEQQTKWACGISHQDITHHSLTQRTLELLGVHELLDFVLDGNSWDEETPITAALANKLRNARNFEIPQGSSKTKKVDQLAEIGVHLTCAKNAGNNGYIGSLLRWYGLKTSRSQNGRVSVYRLDTSDLNITREELTRRANRMINEGLELHPSHVFVDKLSSLHTPFYISNLQKVCADSLSNTETLPDKALSETVEVQPLTVLENPPIITAPPPTVEGTAEIAPENPVLQVGATVKITAQGRYFDAVGVVKSISEGLYSVVTNAAKWALEYDGRFLMLMT